jgi:serine/threonine protein kinase
MWAVGVILYMLLAGEPPFQGALDEEVLDQVRYTEPKMSGGAWDSISPAAKVWVGY